VIRAIRSLIWPSSIPALLAEPCRARVIFISATASTALCRQRSLGVRRRQVSIASSMAAAAAEILPSSPIAFFSRRQDRVRRREPARRRGRVLRCLGHGWARRAASALHGLP
jgi:hypothetical protein